MAQVVKNWPAIRRCGFDAWVGEMPWRRAWPSTPVFLPGESHGWRSLAGYRPHPKSQTPPSNSHFYFQSYSGPNVLKKVATKSHHIVLTKKNKINLFTHYLINIHISWVLVGVRCCSKCWGHSWGQDKGPVLTGFTSKMGKQETKYQKLVSSLEKNDAAWEDRQWKNQGYFSWGGGQRGLLWWGDIRKNRGPSGRDSGLPLQGAWARSSVGELRACMTVTRSHTHTPATGQKRTVVCWCPRVSGFHLPHSFSMLAALLNSISTNFTLTVHCCDTLS